MIYETLLDDEIQDELKNLKTMELGSNTYKVTVEGVTKLIDRTIEMRKINMEHEERLNKQIMDEELKLKEMEMERKDRRVKNTLTAIGIAVPTAVTIWGVCASFKFEEEGTITTMMGRGLINRLLPKM